MSEHVSTAADSAKQGSGVATGSTLLEHLRAGVSVKGLTQSNLASIVSVKRIGERAVELVYEDADGKLHKRIVYREETENLSIVTDGHSWTLDADGNLLRLLIEAHRIKLAHHFDPYLAIHTSLVEPLPHQITAVYGELLSRQPLRFLLADDPGAGKTIMAGLFIKELIARGDLERCLIVAPGALVEQWQDELGDKFNLEFEILTREMFESSRSGNPFNERNLLIARLDVLARNEENLSKLAAAEEWDLIIADEAHRMSASYFGKEVKRTKRYHLGQNLSKCCRHLLLITATPHNGREEDFQLFLALLDVDRFEGKFRKGIHSSDASDLMRRLTKEELLKFDSTPLFPERRAYTAAYELSDMEMALYNDVTEYVKEEMNRVNRYTNNDGKRKNNVGFALQILQRRLASSPAAIHNSLKRRHERLKNELARLERINGSKQGDTLAHLGQEYVPEGFDIGELGDDELEEIEDELSASATNSATGEQLILEIATLRRLESQAFEVLHSGKDTKWLQLNRILDEDTMVDRVGNRRKLIIFTEAKDTLLYLASKIRNFLGRPENVAVIHGGVSREARKSTIKRFMQDRDLLVLVANDAAGEGVNLQRGHLMVNYDLPWNPNKIEQRFGRIHRIGQTEVCHLWNMVAKGTREGDVFVRLLDKLEIARKALKGRVYDVLGELFDETSLRELLWEAIQYGQRRDVQASLFKKIDGVVDLAHIGALLEKKKLTRDMLPPADIEKIKLQMDRLEAQRLQPHHIQSFCIKALEHLSGRVKLRECGRYEVVLVPKIVRDRSRMLPIGAILPSRLERICFDKQFINQQPVADFVCPGHPLLEAVISLIQEQHADLMKTGAIMVDDSDESVQLQAIFLIEHSVVDGRTMSDGSRQVISKRLQFASVNEEGEIGNAGLAPHLNFRAAKPEEQDALRARIADHWAKHGMENLVKEFASIELAHAHLSEVKLRRLPEIEKIELEVQARLKKEINYWDGRAADLRDTEKASNLPSLNSEKAQRRADELAMRMKTRLELLEMEKGISATTPVVRGGLAVIPRGLLAKLNLPTQDDGDALLHSHDQEERRAVELAAMDAVMDAERSLGNVPEDVSASKLGYDILSYCPKSKANRFIEVKGRAVGADSITVTRNEIITSLNKMKDYILAIALVNEHEVKSVRYVWRAFDVEPAFGVTSQVFSMSHLLDKSCDPK